MKRILAAFVVMVLAVGLLAPSVMATATEQSSATPLPGGSSADVHTELLTPSGGIPVLVLQQVSPWGYSGHISSLVSLGYAPTVADWAQIGVSVWLNDFRYIYISSVQPDSFYSDCLAHKAELTQWVEDGGRLFFSACTQGPVFELPGGAVHVRVMGPTNYIADPTHPIVTGFLSDGIALRDVDLVGNLCSHNYFTVLPEQEHTILRDTSSHKPTLVEYGLGTGLVMGSGLTWEYYLANGSLSGNGAFALRAFDDVILYMFPRVTHTITASAGVGGSISPSGTVTVVDGSSRSFVITANAGNSIAGLAVDETAVAVTDRSQMTYTFASVVANHTISATFVTPDMLAPTITWPLELMGSATVRSRSLALLLDVRDDRGDAFVQVLINGIKAAETSQNGPRTYNLFLAEGVNTIYIAATDAGGNMADATLRVTADSTGPVLSAHIVRDGTVTSIVGSAVDSGSGLRSLVVADQDVAVSLDGDFSVPVRFKPGTSSTVVEATDNVGNTATVELALTQATRPAALYKTVTLTIGKASMDVNGMPVSMDAAPVIRNGRTLLPIRALIETLGGKVAWDAKTWTVTVALGEHAVVLVVGKNTALVDGKSIAIDPANAKVVLEIVGSRTFLPLRFIAENLGLDLTWEPLSQTISFTYWP